MRRPLLSPAVVVGALSLAAVIGIYWLLALRPGTNAALVPAPPKIFAALIEEIGPVRATVITYISPAVAAVLGVLVLHESLTPPMLVGFALVIAGSALATRSRGESRDSPALVAEA